MSEPNAPQAARQRIRGLTTVAMLKALLDAGEDYLGIFQPFVFEAIAARADPAFTSREVQEFVAGSFSLNIPEPTLRVLLNRIVQAGNLRREGGRYIKKVAPNPKGIAERRKEIEAEHLLLGSEFLAFAGQQNLDLLTPDAALEVLFDLFDTYQQEYLLNGTLGQYQGSGDDGPHWHHRRTAALFLAERCLQSRKLSPILRRAVEGTVLGSTLLLRDIDSTKKDFKRLQIFLDTSLLLRALGYCGAAQASLATETLSLLRLTNARTLVFDVTVEEIRSILAVYRDKLLSRAGREQLRPTELTRFFLTSQKSSSDIVQAMATLPSDLKSIGVDVVQLPRQAARLRAR